MSSWVFLVACDEKRFVVKQARHHLAVRDVWTADVRRTVTEAHATTLLSNLLPRHIPKLVAVDEVANILVIEGAPLGTVTWKEILLSGRTDASLASVAGVILARIHEGTRGQQLTTFADKRSFVELRVDPYLQTVAERHPDLTGKIEQLIEELTDAQVCLVHGDFSPKNLLVTPELELLLIDHEVAHLGDPRFDLAFFLPHLAAKFVKHGRDSNFTDLMRVFLDSYARYSSDWETISANTPMLASSVLLARIDGKSPLDYLSGEDRDALSQAARAGIRRPAADLQDWVETIAALR